MPYGDYPSTSQDPGVYGTYLADAGTGTGGFFAKQRYYNSNWARFMTVDPLGSSARVASPQSWNRYGYALGDPVNANDPSGLDVVCGAIPSGGEGVRSDSMPCYQTDPGANGVAMDGPGAVGQVQVEGTNITVEDTPLGPDTTRVFWGFDILSSPQQVYMTPTWGGGGSAWSNASKSETSQDAYNQDASNKAQYFWRKPGCGSAIAESAIGAVGILGEVALIVYAGPELLAMGGEAIAEDGLIRGGMDAGHILTGVAAMLTAAPVLAGHGIAGVFSNCH